MDEAMLKSGQFPNVAIMAGTDPKEVMQEYANDDSHDALKEQINRFNASKSEEIAENGTSKGDLNNFDVQNDTREKLNEELMDSCLTFANGGGHLRAFAYVSDLLDRQAAITRRECEERLDFKAITAVANIMNADLTAERDQLSRDLTAEHALVVQFEHDNEKIKADLKTANDTINTLRASVAGLKETVEKLGSK